VSGPEHARRVRSDRTALWEEGRPLLTWLDLELTERCDNDCVHCSINRPADDREAQGRESGTERIKGLLEEAAGLGCLTVRFTGGEPLLRDDFEEIYVFARRLGLRVLLFTNATLLTPRLAGLLARVPPLEKVEVSVYGPDAAVYEACTRRAGSYAAARRGLGLLVEHRVPFLIKSARLPGLATARDRFEAWATGLSGQSATAWAMFFDLRSRRDGGKNDLIRSLRITAAEAGRLMAESRETERAELVDFVARHGGPPGDRLFTCNESGGKGAVDAYGVFQYCLPLRHPETVFDLGRGSLREALRDFLPALRKRRAANPEYLRRCARCFLKSLCLQCPAKSWAEHGTLDTPVEYLCGVTHAQAEVLGLVGPGEKSWAVEDWAVRIAPRSQGA
jgi:MoaA/NifB/PqqE/SkfB family radical SAM enzyme